MTRPRLLILTKPRVKSPVAMDMYDHFLRPDGAFEAYKWLDHAMYPLETVIDQYMGGKPPDIILAGFGCDYGTFANFQNAQYLKNNNIKLCFHVGDATNFLEEPTCVSMHAVVKYDYLWQPCAECPDMPINQQLTRFKERFLNTKDTRLFFVPWGYDPDKYFDAGYRREISVMFAQTADAFAYNCYRARMHDQLAKMANSGILPDCHLQPRNPQDGKYYGMWGYAYIDTLQRSKIMMVDTSQRHWMTAKYLEAAACGCLLMGDVPWGMEDVFNDDTMAVLDYDNLEQDMDRQIRYYLSHDKDRIEKVTRLKKILEERFTNDKIVPQVEAELLKGLEG